MGFSQYLVLLLTHPFEFRTLLQYKLYHSDGRDITAMQEHPTSGWDRESMRKCWHFLDLTSRSFAAVIKELDGDLARTICLFYLVLRGLDTVEDDKTLDPELKQSILRSFATHTTTPGWTFHGSGPNEQDRIVLQEYDCIVEEMGRLPASYREVILDICSKMQLGMADYCLKSESNQGSIYIESVEEYDLYCHYVAGLVGEGLSRIFAATEKEAPWIADQLELSNSMGLLLQKTNITRDYREDCEDKRYFWPREIWFKFGFKEMNEMYESGNEQRAQWAQSSMVLDALRHSTDALDYLRLLKNQSVFNFCAIPATMAMATLELCFMNPDMFQKNIKIRRAEAASLIMRSTNPREVAYIFRDFARKMHVKAVPSDPNFIPISVACGKIEQWCEHQYPSFVSLAKGGSSLNPEDARTRVVMEERKFEEAFTQKRRMERIRAEIALKGNNRVVDPKGDEGSLRDFLLFVGAALLVIFLVGAGGVYLVMQLNS